ncbi:MAG: sialidase family protein [Spirochaetia bacterium]
MAIGKLVCELSPSGNNPRNSEGAFFSPDGKRVMFVYSRYTGSDAEDDAEAEIAGIISYDDGESWSEPVTIDRPERYGALNLMSVSMVKVDQQTVKMFFIVRYGWHDSRLHMRASVDGGGTWSDAVCCIPAPGYYVVNNDRVIRLDSGRLIIPSSYHKMKGEDTKNWDSFDSRGTVFFFMSDDDGKTWFQSDTSLSLSNRHSKSGLQEPGIIPLENGVLWAWFRTDIGRQYESFSFDSGRSWTAPSPSFFTGPCSPLSVKRIPHLNLLAAVWNPVPNYNGRNIIPGTAGRTPLVISLSSDDGKTWAAPRAVEDDETRGFCYTAIHPLDEYLLISYCAGGPEDRFCLSRTRVRKILYNDIIN